MENDIEVLGLLAEVTIAFVAFVTIVASIKLSFGADLTPYQRLIIHYFTESCLISISILLITIVLIQWFPVDEALVSRIACAYSFIVIGLYLGWYVQRRLALNVAIALVPRLVMGGYLLAVVLMGITISGLIWRPTVTIVEALAVWNLIGAAVIFSSFLSSFIDKDRAM